MQELFLLDEDATLLWVGYHPVWLIWGDDRLKLDLRRHYVTGEQLALPEYRANGHLSRLDDARAPDDVLECMALARIDEEPFVAERVFAGVERFYGARMLQRFKRSDTEGRRWARWMIRRRMISPGAHAQRLDAACQKLITFGSVPPSATEAAPLAKARIEAIYRSALHRPEVAGIACEVLTQYAVGHGFPPRRLAAQHLACLPSRVCRERFLALMHHADPLVRENTTFAVPRNRDAPERAELIDVLFEMLDDPELAVAKGALNAFVAIIAEGTRLSKFRDYANTLAEWPTHRLHSELIDSVSWYSDEKRSRPRFHKRVGVAKGKVLGPSGPAASGPSE